MTRSGSISRSTFGRTIAAFAAVVSAVLILGAAPATAAPDPARNVGPDFRKALADSQAAIGRPLLDVSMRDHTGKPVRFSDFAGKPLLVSLVYTGCFQACPVATQFLAQAVRAARDALGEDRFRIVSIGFNQPFDDPAAMAAFRKQNGIDDRDWYFLSPDPAQVDALMANLGFNYEATPKGFDHVTQVTVVDADGVIYRQIYGESFDLPMLVQPLKELLSGQASRELTLENVWEKVKLYCTVYDPNSGGYRVNYGLFFEIFAGLTTLGAMAWFVVRGLRNPNRA
ncbi:MAG: SCO family protein [Burkholderiaceae bacterium]|nr:SCO family protein [Burkholderiaceae bacterium]